ncbi:MAG: hypothetical protein AAF747_06775, partial [Planctomycetota bacterium]
GEQAEGQQADRESSAAARVVKLEAQPGRPIARDGVEIKTVRPRFTTLTRITTTTPDKNPIARVTFGRDGKVMDARLVRGVGRSDIDGPLLDALYRWTAEGERFKALPVRADGSVVTYEFTINFGGR